MLSSDEIAEVIQLKKENLSNREIGRRLGRSCGVINNYFANPDGYGKNRKGYGKTATTEAERDEIHNLAESSKSFEPPLSAREIAETVGTSASLTTVRRIIRNPKKMKKEKFQKEESVEKVSHCIFH